MPPAESKNPALFSHALGMLTAAQTLRLLGTVGLLGWALAWAAWCVWLPPDMADGTQALGGDLISFYTAGTLILDGHGPRLYDLALQYDTQHALIGNPQAQSLCSYVNPPLLGAVLAPLALVPLKAAYVLYTLLAFAAWWLTVRQMAAAELIRRADLAAWLGLGFLFPPLCISITGGQNTAFSLLLLTWFYCSYRRGEALLAGVALGLLSYKPQIGALVGLLVLVQGAWRTVGVAGVVVALHYLLGAAIGGWNWPLAWLQTLSTYAGLERQINALKAISLPGVVEACGYSGWAPWVAGSVLLPLVVAAAILWLRTRPNAATFGVIFAGTVALGLCVSPHAVWYDAGVLLLPAALLLENSRTRGQTANWRIQLGLLLGFGTAGTFGLAPALGWQPVACLPPLMLIWAAAKLRIAPPASGITQSSTLHRPADAPSDSATLPA